MLHMKFKKGIRFRPGVAAVNGLNETLNDILIAESNREQITALAEAIDEIGQQCLIWRETVDGDLVSSYNSLYPTN
jgi:hypothetical protein